MRNIFITIKKELRSIIRDKKSLGMMLATPLMIPVFVFVFSLAYNSIFVESNEAPETYTFGVNYELNETEKGIIKELNLESVYYSTKDELQTAYEAEDIDAYVILTDHYTVYGNPKVERSSLASTAIVQYLDTYNVALGESYLTAMEIDPAAVYSNITYELEELPGKNDLLKFIIISAFIFAVMSITLTAIYCTTDSTAGEKEHGTLETLLTFPIKSNELIIGKYLAITIACIVTSIISIAFVIVSLNIVSSMFEIYQNTVFDFNPLTISLALIIMFIYSAFISGLSIIIASTAKTYKEAQSSLTPLSLVTMIPMFLTLFKVEMSPVLSMIPVINHTLLINDIFLGEINPLNLLIMFVSTIILTIIILIYVSKQYKSEKILFSI